MAERPDDMSFAEWLDSMTPIDLGDDNHRAGFWETDHNDGRGTVRDLATVHRCRMPNGEVKRVLGHCDISTGTRHQLISEDPLHIEASVLCVGCQDHGFIRDGRWVSA